MKKLLLSPIHPIIALTIIVTGFISIYSPYGKAVEKPSAPTSSTTQVRPQKTSPQNKYLLTKILAEKLFSNMVLVEGEALRWAQSLR